MTTGTLTGGTLIIEGDAIGFDWAIGTTTTTGFLSGNPNEITIDSFDFKVTSDGNFIEVVKRQEPDTRITYTVNFNISEQTTKDRVWKEIYGMSINDAGKRELKLIRTIEGEVSPGHYVEERVEFND